MAGLMACILYKPTIASWFSLAIVLLQNACYALSSSSHHPRSAALIPPVSVSQTTESAYRECVISRKSDGSCTIFSFGDIVEKERAEGIEKRSKITRNKRDRIRAAIRSTFLPNVATSGGGTIPHMHAYISFILYDNMKDFLMALSSNLVKQRILVGVGMGRPGATALSATLKFLLRDGCGIVSSLLFSSFAASALRRDVKRWKFFSAVMLDVGLTLQIVASSLGGGWFLPMLCVGAACEAMYNVAASPCTGVIKLHWAVKLLGTGDGIAEIAAKRRAQKTLIELVGLVFSGTLAKWVDGIKGMGLLVGLYGGLIALHLASVKKSLQLVSLDWLNPLRLKLLVQEFLTSVEVEEGANSFRAPKQTVYVSSPSEVSENEPLLFIPGLRTNNCDMRMGVSFNDIAQLSLEPLPVLQTRLRSIQRQGRDKYMVVAGYKSATPALAVSLFDDSSGRDVAKAYLHGALLRHVLLIMSKKKPVEEDNEIEKLKLIRKAEALVDQNLSHLWPLFYKCATDTGWDLDKTECSTEGYKIKKYV